MEDTQLAEMIEGLQNSEQETLEVSIPVEITVEETKEPEASHKPLKQESSEEEVALEKPKLVENPRTTEKPSANEERQEAKQGREDGNQTAFAQSLKPTEMHQAQAAEGAERVSVWDADTQNIMRQIMDYMKVQVKQGVSNLEMQLHPASLGTVQIQLVSKGGAVSAHFITENEAVKATLESQLVQLKESFAEQGVRVEAVEVSVQTHQFERNLDQGRGRQQEDSKKTKNGRIRMTGAAMAEEEEELPAEEMQINGSTVNYTA